MELGTFLSYVVVAAIGYFVGHSHGSISAIQEMLRRIKQLEDEHDVHN